MLLRSRETRPRLIMTIGLACLALGGLARLFLKPGPHLSANLLDGMTGFLYGVAIALLLLNLAVNRGRGREL
jgi:hypothetical protein